MCSVSMIADDWTNKRMPQIFPHGLPVAPGPSRAEFDALRAELMALREELRAAKLVDEANGEPDCEMEEKVAIFRRLGEMVGIDFDEVLKNAS